MTFILNEKYKETTQNLSFLVNRLLKIFPLYFLILLINILYCIINGFINDDFLLLSHFKDLPIKTFAFITLIISNLFIVGQDIFMFLKIDSITGIISSNFKSEISSHYYLLIPQAWSLSIELYFYLIAPFILRKNSNFVFLLLILTIIIRVYIFDFLNLYFDPWSYRFFPAELYYFLLGYFAYKININLDPKKAIYLIVIISLFTIFFYVIPLYGGLKIESLKQIYLCILIISLKPIFEYTKFSKIDIFSGELSYPIYLIHTLVILVVTTSLSLKFHNVYFILLITLISSILLKFTIVDPINRYKQKSFIKCVE